MSVKERDGLGSKRFRDRLADPKLIFMQCLAAGRSGGDGGSRRSAFRLLGVSMATRLRSWCSGRMSPAAWGFCVWS